MKSRKPAYKAPRNAAERIAEAKAAIERIEASMTGNNRFGSYGDSCRDSIKRWQAVIDREVATPELSQEQLRDLTANL